MRPNGVNTASSRSTFPGWQSVDDRWVIAHTKSRQEKSLVADLKGERLQVFFPAIRELRTHGGRKRWVDMPLFSGYVFVRGDDTTGTLLRKTGRVANVIDVADQRRLTHELMQIHNAIEAGGELSQSPLLAAGIPAQIVRGPLKGIEGVVESVESATRLVLVVETLGQATSVEIAPGDVVPLSD